MGTLFVAIPSGALTLDAGSVSETIDGFTILPPTIPMIDQLLAYLDGQPRHDDDIQIRHQAVGCAALCVRWGTYLATLTDANTPLHPDLAGHPEHRSQQYSFISDAEMRRLNVEVSANLARLVRVYRERGRFALYTLLAKAHTHLPMRSRASPRMARRRRCSTARCMREHASCARQGRECATRGLGPALGRSPSGMPTVSSLTSSRHMPGAIQ